MRSQRLPLFRRYESRWWKCFVNSDIREGLWSRALGQRTHSSSACRVRTAPKRKWPLLRAPTRTYWKSVTVLIHVDKKEKKRGKKAKNSHTESDVSHLCLWRNPDYLCQRFTVNDSKSAMPGKDTLTGSECEDAFAVLFLLGFFPRTGSVLFRTDWLNKWLRMRISMNSSSITRKFALCSVCVLRSINLKKTLESPLDCKEI